MASQGWIFDYEGATPPTLWLDPVEVAPLLGLDYNSPEHLLEVADVVAEASSIIDQYTGKRYGPARCVAATYRMRGFPLLDLVPPAANIVKVILHHDQCYPNQPVPIISEVTPVSMEGSPAAPDLVYTRNLVAMLNQAGDQVGNASPPLTVPDDPDAPSISGAYSWCLDNARLLRLCGLPQGGMVNSCGPACQGSELITVFYRTRENWPPGLKRALLALVTGIATSGGCPSLPIKTTSVQRQGVSWTVDEASDGITGVNATDRWISRHRPGVRLSDPMRASLNQMQYLDCTAFYPFYGEDQYIDLGPEFEPELVPDPVPTDPLGLLDYSEDNNP